MTQILDGIQAPPNGSRLYPCAFQVTGAEWPARSPASGLDTVAWRKRISPEAVLETGRYEAKQREKF